MINEQYFNLLRNRHEIIELFQHLRGQDPDQSRTFFPILSLIAPAGSGKSALIDHLLSYRRQKSALPYAFLDFVATGAPKDLPNILNELCKQLQARKDGQKHLTFPRFDIVFKRLKQGDRQRSGVNEEGQIPGDLVALIGSMNLDFRIALPLFFFLKLLANIQLFHALLRWSLRHLLNTRRNRPEWLWYREQARNFRELRLQVNIDRTSEPDIGDIRERLSAMAASRHEKDFLILRLLPDAFLADLRAAFTNSGSSRVWNEAESVVIFLDSFDELQRVSETVSKQLLEVLTLSEERKQGRYDPLLLVIGGENRLPGMSREQLNRHYVSWHSPDGELVPWSPINQQSKEQPLLDHYHQWQQRLPTDKERLKLEDLYLPLPLRDFRLDETRTYLLLSDKQTQMFHNEALLQSIYRETWGYPAYLASITKALTDGAELQRLFVSDDGTKLVDDLLAPHCPPEKVTEIILSAAPRTLTSDILGVALASTNGTGNSERWDRYRRLAFVLASEDRSKITYHPGIRALLLQKLTIGNRESDYTPVHERLYKYFQKRFVESAKQGQKSIEDRTERSYHQLALGEVEPVIQLATAALQYEIALWEPLLEVVGQAPIRNLPANIENDAAQSLMQASQLQDLKSAVRAIILYTWLLVRPESDKQRVADNLRQLGDAFKILLNQKQKIRLDAAHNCYKRWAAMLQEPVAQQLSTLPTVPLPPTQHSKRGVVSRSWQIIWQSLVRSRIIRLTLILVLVIASIGAFALHRYLASRTEPPPSTISPFGGIDLADLKPDVRTKWIGVKAESNQEYDGLSDGSVPFDIVRADGQSKIEATKLFRQQNFAQVVNTLQTAVNGDTNDAEALIYQENARIREARQHCYIYIVATAISEDSGEGVTIGRDNLQGAYAAQKENNTINHDKVCLYVANLGSSAASSGDVARQIVQAVAADKDIKGIMGWPLSSSTPDTVTALQILASTHVPIVSTTSYDELQIASNVFHVSPSDQAQGRRAADYALQTLHKSKAALFVDPFDIYSRSLAQGFKERFELAGGTITTIKNYVTAHTDAKAFTRLLDQTLQAAPNCIYFAGNLDDGLMLLADLTNSSSRPPVLGGDAFYPLIGYSSNARPGFSNLAFTTLAYPYTQPAMHMKDLYAHYFNHNDAQNNVYGYSLPDSNAIVSYDAMQVLLKALSSVGSGDMLHTLVNVNIQGASRARIAFNNKNALSDTNVSMLSVDAIGQAQFLP